MVVSFCAVIPNKNVKCYNYGVATFHTTGDSLTFPVGQAKMNFQCFFIDERL